MAKYDYLSKYIKTENNTEQKKYDYVSKYVNKNIEQPPDAIPFVPNEIIKKADIKPIPPDYIQPTTPTVNQAGNSNSVFNFDGNKITETTNGITTNIPQPDEIKKDNIFDKVIDVQNKVLNTAKNLPGQALDVAKNIPGQLIDLGKKTAKVNDVNLPAEVGKTLGRGTANIIGGFGGLLQLAGNKQNKNLVSPVDNYTEKILKIKQKQAIDKKDINAINNANKELLDFENTKQEKINQSKIIKKTLKQYGANLNKVNENINKILEEDPRLTEIRKKNILHDIVFSGLESTPGFLAGVGTTILTKNPNAGLAFLSMQSAGDTYKNAIALGNDHDTAEKAALISAITNFLTERLSLEYITKTGIGGKIAQGFNAKINKNWITQKLGHIGMSGLFEGSEEFIQYFADLIDAKYKTFITSGYDPKRNFNLRDLAVSTGSGAIMGGAGATVSGVDANNIEQTNVQPSITPPQQALPPAQQNMPVQPQTPVIEPAIKPEIKPEVKKEVMPQKPVVKKNKIEKYNEYQNSGVLTEFENQVIGSIKEATDLNMPDTVKKLETILDTKKIEELIKNKKLNEELKKLSDEVKTDVNKIKGGDVINEKTGQEIRKNETIKRNVANKKDVKTKENVKKGNVLKTADELVQTKGELSPISYLKKRGLRIALDDVVRNKGLDNKQFRFVTSNDKNASNVIGYDELSSVFKDYYPDLTNDEILDKIIKGDKLFSSNKIETDVENQLVKREMEFNNDKPNIEANIKNEINKTNDVALKSLLKRQLETLKEQSSDDYVEISNMIDDYKNQNIKTQPKQSIDTIFNASGKYPKAGINFVRPLKQLVTDGGMSTIPGGKVYTATKQQIRDAGKLLEAIRKDDIDIVKDIANRYPYKNKMVTGKTAFVPHDNVYNTLKSSSLRVLEALKANEGSQGNQNPSKTNYQTKTTQQKQAIIKRGMAEMKANATRDTQLVSESNIPKENQLATGVKELIDYYKSKDMSGKQVYELYTNKQTLQDEINNGNLTKEEARQVLSDSDISNLDPSLVRILGSNNIETRNNIETDVIRLFGGANITTVIEKRAELVYKNMAEQDSNFENNIKKWRADYEKNTGQISKKADIEWFSDLAIDYAIHNKINMKINIGLRKIFQALKRYLRLLLKRASVLRIAIKNGKINQGLVNSLDKAVFGDIKSEQKIGKNNSQIPPIAYQNQPIETMTPEQLYQQLRQEIEQEKIRQDKNTKEIVSTPKSRQEAINKPIQYASGKTKDSKAFDMLSQNLIRELGNTLVDGKEIENPKYEAEKLIQNRLKAIKFVDENYDFALKVANNEELPPEGIGSNMIKSEVLKRLTEQGKIDEANLIANDISLSSTRYGFEIVSLKEIYGYLPAMEYVKQLQELKIQRKLKYELKKGDKNESKTEKLNKKIKEETAIARRKIVNKVEKMTRLDKLLDSIIC